MSKTIEKEVYVYGMIYTPMGIWQLLSPEPEKNSLPFYLRNDAYRFHIIDEDVDGHDVETYLDIKGDFAVVLYPQLGKATVKFIVEDVDEVAVDSVS